MFYPSSENKGADQLRGYREADLRLCFRLGKNPVFSRCGSYDFNYEIYTNKLSQNTSLTGLIIHHTCTGRKVWQWGIFVFGYSATDPGFLEGGSNPSRELSFSTFYLMFHIFPHQIEIIQSQRGVQANHPNSKSATGYFKYRYTMKT